MLAEEGEGSMDIKVASTFVEGSKDGWPRPGDPWKGLRRREEVMIARRRRSSPKMNDGKCSLFLTLIASIFIPSPVDPRVPSVRDVMSCSRMRKKISSLHEF